ncbi:SMAD/FHA domain-containing protein [Cytidiella melzeri]|nr:SMAD/FHA domain-containing protein [Cytidiella melzeri]
MVCCPTPISSPIQPCTHKLPPEVTMYEGSDASDETEVVMFEATQRIQQVDDEYTWAVREGFWGILEPLDGVSPIILLRHKIYHIGRSKPRLPHECIIVEHSAVSRSHCTIEWNGRDDSAYEVVVKDIGSTYGTFINNEELSYESNDGIRMGRLCHGNIISFGTESKVPPLGQKQDNRYRYVHIAQSMNVSLPRIH